MAFSKKLVDCLLRNLNHRSCKIKRNQRIFTDGLRIMPKILFYENWENSKLSMP